MATLKSGVVASLTYVTNWWLAADDQPYFAFTGRPPMVQHLWSLAIEEQFYLVWSVVVVVVVGVAARRADPAARVRLVAVVALVLAAASTVTMAVIAVRSGLPFFGDTSRVYYGSDTHAMGLFLGSACGAWLAVRHRDAPIPSGRLPAKFVWLTDVAGAVLLVVLIVELLTITEFSPVLYRGGFLAFGVLVLAVALCALRRRSLLGRILDMRPIRWVGQRSYSIYIWHWPVVVVTRPDLDVRGPALVINLCRLVLILGLAALSHHFIEVPLRSDQFARWRSARANGARKRWDTVAAAATLIAALSLGVAASAVGSPQAPPVHVRPRPVPSTHAAAPAPRPSSPVAPQPRRPTHKRPAPPAHRRVDVSAFGDSVLLGGRTALGSVTSRLDMDAVVGRQPYEVLDDVVARAAHGTLQPDVVIHTGNNGIISPDQLRSTLTALRDRHRVVLLTDRVARDWQDPNNATITSVGKAFRNVVVLDWYARSAGNHAWLGSDGLHLTTAGARAYARLVRAALTQR
jgi:peptidoglycan/LPS O-acetylase OafA/YrhL